MAMLPANKSCRRLCWVFLTVGVYSLAITAGCGILPQLPTDSEFPSHPKGVAETPVQIGKIKSGKEEPITRGQLQAALMDFADRFSDTVVTGTEKSEEGDTSPQARLVAARSRFYLPSSAIGIAAGPNPGIALLDMVVLATLSRMIWEEYWQPQVFGSRAEVLVRGLRDLEADIWSIAAKVLTKGQVDELRGVILEWRQKHPDETGVSFVRFRDFGKLRPDSPLADVIRPTGFFAEVSEATRAADEIRLFGDRAMYLLSRMQAITNLQVDLVFMELITEPEIRQLLADGARFTTISERFAEIIEQFPAQVAEERHAAINQLTDAVSKERSAFINQLTRAASNERKRLMEDLISEEKGVKDLFADLRQIIEAGNKLAVRINTAVNSADTLAARFETGPDQEPLSIKDYRQILSEFTVSTQELNTLVHSVDELLTSAKLESPLPVAFKLTDRVEALGMTWMKESFILGAALILVFFMALLLYRLISQWLVATRKKQTLTAVLLVAAAAWISGYLAFSGGASSQAVVSGSDPNESERFHRVVYKGSNRPGGKVFSGPIVQQKIPRKNGTKSCNQDPDGLQSVAVSYTHRAVPSSPHGTVRKTVLNSRSALMPDFQSLAPERTKGRKDTPENVLQLGTPAPQASTVDYTIQLGSFRNPKHAEKSVQLFKSLGLDAFAHSVDLPGKGVFHRVLVGSFGSRGQARRYQTRLQEEYNLNESLIISCSEY